MVGFTGVVEGRFSLGVGRVFEYMDAAIKAQFSVGNVLRLDDLKRLPCLLMDEGTGDEIARVGRIITANVESGEVHVQVALEHGMPERRIEDIYARLGEFGMGDWEFSRAHWAVKDIDLYRTILRMGRRERKGPTLFRVADPEKIDAHQISVMMPFDGRCAGVYDDIKAMAVANALKCIRADDIWQHDHILTDIVSLSVRLETHSAEAMRRMRTFAAAA